MSREDSRKTDIAWFDGTPNEDHITPAACHLLDVYSKIPAEEVTDHVAQVLDEAWKIHPYPCVGQFRILALGLKQTEYKNCFGQEIRQLVVDGALSESIYGCDIQPEFFEPGYKLFRNRERLQAKFLTADIFDHDSSLAKLTGNFNMIYAGSFFHLFDYDDQFKISKTFATLLFPESGSTIFDLQVGAVEAAEHAHNLYSREKMYRQNPESREMMWNKIGEEFGVRFSVKATLQELEGKHFQSLSRYVRGIHFVISRE